MQSATIVKLSGAVIVAGAIVLACIVPAKAVDFTVTTTPLYGGGYKSTYRDLGPQVLGDYGNDGTLVLQGPAPANGCDLEGIGGFETVTRLYAGEKRCNGAAAPR